MPPIPTGCDAVPTAPMPECYSQRASARLILSEAAGISRGGLGWPDAPGLWSEAQVDGWKRATDAVHEAGGRIVAQLLFGRSGGYVDYPPPDEAQAA